MRPQRINATMCSVSLTLRSFQDKENSLLHHTNVCHTFAESWSWFSTVEIPRCSWPWHDSSVVQCKRPWIRVQSLVVLHSGFFFALRLKSFLSFLSCSLSLSYQPGAKKKEKRNLVRMNFSILCFCSFFPGVIDYLQDRCRTHLVTFGGWSGNRMFRLWS